MKAITTLIATLVVFAFNSLSAQNNAIQVSLQNEDGSTSLHWDMQKEVNTSYFIIESSADNQTFATIGEVKAAGYSLHKKTYEFEPNAESAATVYYRVTLVTMQGERSASLAVYVAAGAGNSLLVRK